MPDGLDGDCPPWGSLDPDPEGFPLQCECGRYLPCRHCEPEPPTCCSDTSRNGCQCPRDDDSPDEYQCAVCHVWYASLAAASHCCIDGA